MCGATIGASDVIVITCADCIIQWIYTLTAQSYTPIASALCSCAGRTLSQTCRKALAVRPVQAAVPTLGCRRNHQQHRLCACWALAACGWRRASPRVFQSHAGGITGWRWGRRRGLWRRLAVVPYPKARPWPGQPQLGLLPRMCASKRADADPSTPIGLIGAYAGARGNLPLPCA